MNRLILVRHGENLANLTLEFSNNRVDYPLTEKGVLQAQQTAGFLASRGIQEIYCSPLKRTVETAEIIAAPLGLPVTVMEEFREVNVGDLEGQKPTAALWALHNEIVARWWGGEKDLCFPGGENCLTLQARARRGIEQILAGKDGRTILVVGHGGIFTFGLFRQVLSSDEQAMTNLPMGNCSISELDARLDDGRLDARLCTFASTAHLSGEAAELAPGTMLAEEREETE